MAETQLKVRAEYVIFDVDGLLSIVSDTERIFSEVTNEIFARYGYEFTWEIKAGTMGKVQRAAAEHIYSYFPDLPSKLSIDDYLIERNRMQDERFRTVPLMKGALEVVRGLHAAGIPLALATGSSSANLKLKTSHLPEVFSLFPPALILTADSPEVAPGRGKPKPDIFLAAARALGRDVGTAEECSAAQEAERAKGLVFEDAVPGAQAGVAAGMNVIWIPDPQLRALAPDNDYGVAEILSSLEDWKPAAWDLPAFPIRDTLPEPNQ